MKRSILRHIQTLHLVLVFCFISSYYYIRASRTHMLLCQCWGEGLTVWEVAQCYKRCLIMKRTKPEVTGWEVSEPPLVAVCWSSEGQLYAVDPHAHLYSVSGTYTEVCHAVTNLTPVVQGRYSFAV